MGTSLVDQAESTSRAVAQSHWVDRVARVGFAARGVVYIVIGLLAVALARGRSTGEQADKKGALRAIAGKPFGHALLVIIAVGLVGYSLWRFSEAIWGKRDETDTKKRTAKRLSSAAKGVLYATFAGSAISVVTGSSTSSNDGKQQKAWTARVMAWHGGRGIVAVAGTLIIVGGAYLVYRGIAHKFEKKLNMAAMSHRTERVTRVLGTFGVAARGAVFLMAGLLVVKAAVKFDPSQAEGIDGTLHAIARQTYGQLLLFVSAVGLVAFGLYSFIEARYRVL